VDAEPEQRERRMTMVVEMSLDPIGAGTHLHEMIAHVVEIIRASKLTYELHAMGTNIEGEWDDVMSVVRQCMEGLLEEGALRVSVTLKMTERRDGTPNTIQHMREAIEPHLLIAG
jgi:uncharacterized protein (TIGR00106 family)